MQVMLVRLVMQVLQVSQEDISRMKEIFLVEEKNNGEGKGGKYLETEKEGIIW